MNALTPRLLLAAVLALAAAASAAEIHLTDDSGRAVTLRAPAQRIISLAPHITELLFAAGAGDHVIGSVEFSDYPEAARGIPRVGDSAQLDLERIMGINPDLIVVWQHGNAQRQLDKLLQLGIPVFYNEPRRLPDIAHALEQLGQLAGTEAVAVAAARAFRAREAALRERYEQRPTVSVFYQILGKPLMTINGNQIISDVIRLCGGQNVFAELKPLVPTIPTEAVVTADPEAILSTTAEFNARGTLEQWRKWPRVKAVARDNLFLIPADLISRHTPRILDGAQRMCEHLDTARSRRPQ